MSAWLEEVFQMGVQKVVIFGTCGVLDSRIEDCSITFRIGFFGMKEPVTIMRLHPMRSK